jgi:hypothetical protein
MVPSIDLWQPDEIWFDRLDRLASIALSSMMEGKTHHKILAMSFCFFFFFGVWCGVASEW